MIDRAHGGINGLILNGGKSSRMGSDKGSLSFHGIPQREYLLKLLEKFCDRVFLSCKKNPGSEGLNGMIYDAYAIDSPLNGILSAIAFDDTTAWLTVPVDMPFIDANVIAELISNRDRTCVATCFADSDGRDPEPLLCLWEPIAYPMMRKYFAEGNISPKRFLMTHSIKLLATEKFPSLNVNVNTVEQLDAFRKKQSGQSS